MHISNDAEDIKFIMKRTRIFYGLQCTDMSRICGFGINQWRGYEKGIKPNKSNERLIRIACTPRGLMKLIEIVPERECDLKSYNAAYNKCKTVILEIKNRVDKYEQELFEDYTINK